ncbi:LolA family protein [Larsenimonas rhizosphaerae]|uniref:LolA family protein n=1 Tax=Larsenimonas rhizosphaerae TaxID=2944682 RepID=UPI00203347B3|nr:outer membrane lipoprotein carrier protein LolA [Larsenimonas rhizosphaerae]MCM2131733.1 outer membrane lipoprotein carrier protein LolA [Larsenimonas rhizosphaerae]
MNHFFRLLPLLTASGLLLGTLGLSATAQADPVSMSAIEQQLSRQAHVEGTFVQKRWLHDMQTTLTSHGHYEFDRGEQVRWTLTSPVQETMTLDDTGMTRNGKPVKDDPGGVARLIMQLLDGDLGALQERFTIALSGTTGHWQARLTPRSDSMKRYLERIDLAGGDQLDTLAMHLANEDRLDIRLDQTQSDS